MCLAMALIVLFIFQNSTPMRHKSTHFINVPTYANKVFDFFTALLNDKLKNRVMVLYDEINLIVLGNVHIYNTKVILQLIQTETLCNESVGHTNGINKFLPFSLF